MTKKIVDYAVIIVALALFFIPFFWFEPGFVDFGFDAGRLYFLDPLALIKNTWFLPSSYVYSFANIPYFFFLYILQQVFHSPTILIAIEHGLQLSLSFLGIFLIVKELLFYSEKKVNTQKVSLAGMISGIAYVVFITKMGWPVALPTLNQVFLNVCIFYLLFKYCMTRKYLYMLLALFLSVVFSLNFGFGSAPQLLSFYPLSFGFLYLYTRFIARKKISWKGFLLSAGLFLGLHAMHLLPVIISLLHKDSTINAQVFSKTTIEKNGVDYFTAIHAEFGKMSIELFQSWLGQNLFALVIPIIAVLGFFIRRSKLLSIIGIFFIVTLFLVVANVTHLGVIFYQKLFYIPGFIMFRSFYEKWFYVFAFYYVLLFAVSFYYLIEKRKTWIAFVLATAILSIFIARIFPFLTGKTIHATPYQSKSISTVYSLDPDLLDAITFVRQLPQDGKVLSAPLTYANYQAAFGKVGGGYLGISLVSNVAGRPDFAGLWTLEPYRDPILSALRGKDTQKFLQLLSLLNIRYIFYNSDRRIMEAFPRYFDPRFDYEDTEIPPVIKDQSAYELLFASLPHKKIYQKGFYSIYELEDTIVRPIVYIPDYVKASREEALAGSYRTAYLDCSLYELVCNETVQITPIVSYVKRSPVFFDITIDLKNRKKPFLLVLSNPYYSAWDLSFENVEKQAIINHIAVNGYANGWIIDPTKIKNSGVLRGRIYLTSQNYFYVGLVISSITFIIVLYFSLNEIFQRKYEAK